MSKQTVETARQRRARTSKFNSRDANVRSGSFEVIGLYEGNPNPQPAPFPNLSAALTRYVKISSGNPALKVLRLVEHVTLRDSEGNQFGTRTIVHHQLNRSVQQFANGRNAWWEARA